MHWQMTGPAVVTVPSKPRYQTMLSLCLQLEVSKNYPPFGRRVAVRSLRQLEDSRGDSS